MTDVRTVYARMITQGASGWPELLLLCLLWPLSLVFRLAVRLRTTLYSSGLISSYKAKVPVISVGNLTVGGTGKTPVVDYLVKWFSGRGVKCAVVSRGYGGTYTEDCLRVLTEGADVDQALRVGDEPLLLAQRNPGVAVYVARKRRLGVAVAESDGAECIILDDAFQHHRVARDYNIVLLDAKRPFGNGFMLPAGPLREPESALKRADLLVLTRSALNQKVPFAGDKPVCSCTYHLLEELDSVGGEPATMAQVKGLNGVAFAGIASPQAFFDSLRDAGLSLQTTVSFEDHSSYTDEQIRRIEIAAQDADYLITTEKDAVKLIGKSFQKNCFVVKLQLAFKDEDLLENQLMAVLTEGQKKEK